MNTRVLFEGVAMTFHSKLDYKVVGEFSSFVLFERPPHKLWF